MLQCWRSQQLPTQAQMWTLALGGRCAWAHPPPTSRRSPSGSAEPESAIDRVRACMMGYSVGRGVASDSPVVDYFAFVLENLANSALHRVSGRSGDAGGPQTRRFCSNEEPIVERSSCCTTALLRRLNLPLKRSWHVARHDASKLHIIPDIVLQKFGAEKLGCIFLYFRWPRRPETALPNNHTASAELLHPALQANAEGSSRRCIEGPRGHHCLPLLAGDSGRHLHALPMLRTLAAAIELLSARIIKHIHGSGSSHAASLGKQS
jgi:hypothetical protein